MEAFQWLVQSIPYGIDYLYHHRALQVPWQQYFCLYSFTKSKYKRSVNSSFVHAMCFHFSVMLLVWNLANPSNLMQNSVKDSSGTVECGWWCICKMHGLEFFIGRSTGHDSTSLFCSFCSNSGSRNSRGSRCLAVSWQHCSVGWAVGSTVTVAIRWGHGNINGGRKRSSLGGRDQKCGSKMFITGGQGADVTWLAEDSVEFWIVLACSVWSLWFRNRIAIKSHRDCQTCVNGCICAIHLLGSWMY